jgi:hypothetical protein
MRPEATPNLVVVKLADDVLIAGMNRQRVSQASIVQKLNAALASRAPILLDIESQDR